MTYAILVIHGPGDHSPNLVRTADTIDDAELWADYYAKAIAASSEWRVAIFEEVTA